MKQEITNNDIMKKAFDNGIKVYADFKTRPEYWAVVIEDKYNLIYSKKVNPGEYKHDGKTVSKACIEALEYCYNRLTHRTK